MQIDLLSSILSAISKRVNHQSFNTWFKPISFATRDDSTIYLKVPNEIFRDWITSNYFDVMEESLEELNLEGYQLRFLVEEQQALNRNLSAEIPTRATTNVNSYSGVKQFWNCKTDRDRTG